MLDAPSPPLDVFIIGAGWGRGLPGKRWGMKADIDSKQQGIDKNIIKDRWLFFLRDVKIGKIKMLFSDVL
jgi:hypothetical protein